MQSCRPVKMEGCKGVRGFTWTRRQIQCCARADLVSEMEGLAASTRKCLKNNLGVVNPSQGTTDPSAAYSALPHRLTLSMAP